MKRAPGAEHANTAKEAAFSKDADLLVSQLIAPRWIVAIRLEFPLLVGRQR